MSLVKLIQTTSEMLPTIPMKAGQLIFSTDTKKIHLDVIEDDVNKRIEYYADYGERVTNLEKREVGAVLPEGYTAKISFSRNRSSCIVMVVGGVAAQHRGSWIVQSMYNNSAPVQWTELKQCTSVELSSDNSAFYIKNTNVSKLVTVMGSYPMNIEVSPST